MKVTLKNQHGKFIYGDKYREKIMHMVDKKYITCTIANNKLSIISDKINNDNGRAERVIVVKVDKC